MLSDPTNALAASIGRRREHEAELALESEGRRSGVTYRIGARPRSA
ncbi:hypothetical protein AKJ09_06619 [Labilithrix luteola]|uniref:Uncharacterized protein n=1 Tax=Labilithrix luteola TaxID=1391654 RepID=A0A0K1Q2B6_9BACT|nr:hypothetical protein AKJ09_06619 [Labilithrix luteola]